jgi:hypothetical protein
MIKITFTIGIGKDKTGKPIPECDMELAKLRACKLIAREFGGYTAYVANGGWVDPSGKLIEEPSLVISTITDKPGNRELAKDCAEGFKLSFNQDCIMVTRDVVSMELV